MLGSDYHSNDSLRVFNSGSSDDTNVCISITIEDDQALEEDESFTVSLMTSDSSVVLEKNTTFVIIRDNDG